MEGLRPEARDIGRAAADLLGPNSDRRKRSRTSGIGSNGHGAYSTMEAPKNTSVHAQAAAALARESPSYKRLVEMEERLDLAIMRKQQDIREALKTQAPVCKRVFRLYIFNTYRSQPGKEGVTNEDVPSWSLRIQGQLLPTAPPASHGGASARMQAGSSSAMGNAGQAGGAANGLPAAPNAHMQAGAGQPGEHHGMAGMAAHGGGYAGYPPIEEPGSKLRTSDIFKRIVVELDNELYPENNLIEWKHNERDLASDGFEISRKGSEECRVRILLDVNHTPEVFKLSPQLASVLGLKSDTRAGIFVALWQYVKKNRLQCVDDRNAVRLDSGLKALLPSTAAAREHIRLASLYELAKTHMLLLEPLEVEYSIRLSGNVVDNQDVYDIQVNVEDRALQESAKKSGIFGLTFPVSAEYTALKEKHYEALAKIALHKRRRDFFEGFCKNPCEFINHLVLSQTRDLKVLGGSTGRNPEEERRASFYQQQWVHEAIPRYLLRKAIADTAKKTSESAK